MPRVGFEPTISAGERPKTYALYHAATGTGGYFTYYVKTVFFLKIVPVNKISNDYALRSDRLKPVFHIKLFDTRMYNFTHSKKQEPPFITIY